MNEEEGWRRKVREKKESEMQIEFFIRMIYKVLFEFFAIE